MRTQFYLQEPILSVQNQPVGRPECVYVPAGEVISISSSDKPSSSGFVEVVWNARVVLVFSEDLKKRATPFESSMAG